MATVVSIAPPSPTHIIVRGTTRLDVRIRPRKEAVRIVQAAVPLTASQGGALPDYIDGGNF